MVNTACDDRGCLKVEEFGKVKDHKEAYIKKPNGIG